MPASGRSSTSVSVGDIHVIATNAAGNAIAVCARYMMPGPTLKRTASTSLVKRESRSPVRMRSKKGTGRSIKRPKMSRFKSRST